MHFDRLKLCWIRQSDDTAPMVNHHTEDGESEQEEDNNVHQNSNSDTTYFDPETTSPDETAL